MPASFPMSKDPADVAWYQVLFGEPLDTLLSLTVEPNPVTTNPLIVTLQQLMPEGAGITFKAAGGAEDQTYELRAGVVTVSGSTLYRSVLLNVSPL